MGVSFVAFNELSRDNQTVHIYRSCVEIITASWASARHQRLLPGKILLITRCWHQTRAEQIFISIFNLFFFPWGWEGREREIKVYFLLMLPFADLKARTLKTVLNGLEFLQMLINTDKCICSVNCSAFSTTACEVSVCEEGFLSDTQRKTKTSYFTKKKIVLTPPSFLLFWVREINSCYK